MGDSRKLKIEIDREECIGDGACVDDAPETFELDDEDKAVIKDPVGNDADAIIEAGKNCPTDCITITDAATGEKLCPEG